MRIAAKAILGVDITEIYSPERVVKVANAMGFRGGLSFDLTNGWNFNVEEDCEEAWQYITTKKPRLVIGSPMCTMFSALQNMRKKNPAGDARYEYNLKNAMEHIRSCVKIYQHQDENDRYYLHEHPATATSSQMPEMEALRASPNALETVSHLCAYGLNTTVEGRKLLAKKPTRFLTNSPLISI